MKFAAIAAIAAVATLAGASLASASSLLAPGEARAAHKARRSEVSLEKRYRVYSGGQGTYYDGSKLGDPACGGSAPSDSSMAIAVPEGSPGRCGDWLHITYNGKSVSAKVVDSCASCSSKYDVDMTKAVFEELADLNVGVLKPLKYRVLENN